VSYVKGKVIDHETGKTILPQIKLFDLASNQELQQIYPFENEGDFLLCLPVGKNYGLSLEREGYLFTSNNFNLQDTHTKANPLLLTISMDPIKPGKTTILNNIFFDTNSANLKPESETQLNQMVLFLSKNKNLVVEIGGHTDNVGTQKYNEELSQKRAETVVKYLTDKGIPENRLKSKGYGFSQPVADNSTEERRANNRRTEFKILGN
jgi:outer membrane protein OmpA-like peptidoglycan-associated protein